MPWQPDLHPLMCCTVCCITQCRCWFWQLQAGNEKLWKCIPWTWLVCINMQLHTFEIWTYWCQKKSHPYVIAVNSIRVEITTLTSTWEGLPSTCASESATNTCEFHCILAILFSWFLALGVCFRIMWAVAIPSKAETLSRWSLLGSKGMQHCTIRLHRKLPHGMHALLTQHIPQYWPFP